MAGLISEEEAPSLYSFSLSNSVCSSSTVDLEALELNGTCSMFEYAQPFHSSPMENNFMEEKNFKPSDVHQVSTPETAIDTSNSLTNNSRNCISLHDVSSLTPLQLPVNSTNTVSCETIHSQSLSSTTKSKDSGFQRSVSCLSLSSGRRNYDHVESKVKAYIRNIKESEALRKQQLLAEKSVVYSEPKSNEEFEPCLDKDGLVQKVLELKDELHEKAMFIDTQQRNYNSLLLKLAEAKNTINALRLERISLNYSSTNGESHTTRISDIDLGAFEQEICRKQNELSNTVTRSFGSNLNEKKCFVAVKPSNDSFIDTFQPKNNSTPQKDFNKDLSPISKIFSSSSRLDKSFRPLVSLIKEKSCSVSLLRNSNRSNALNQSPGKKVTENLKSKYNKICKGQQKQRSTLLCNKKHVTTNIDLPNDDPFDKVKKWQASLPSINLLGTQSSSDCEESLKASKNSSKLLGHSENEINGSLSVELMSKLKISDKPVKSSSCINIAKHQKKTLSLNLSNFSIKNTSNNFEPKKNQTTGSEFEKVSSTNKSNNFQTSTESPIPSTSGSEIKTYLPKSSSWVRSPEKQINSDSSDSSDDSSSVSSLVSSSKESLSHTPSTKSNRKFPLRKSKTDISISNPLKQNSANTRIVLQKPKLNYKPMTNISNFNNDTVLQKRTKSLNRSTSNLHNLKVESSQRKAWNERNTTNFYVCKEFYLKRSSSLQECLNIMENLVEEGSSIIKTTLERNHCH